MGFFRQENWSGLPFPSPGDLPDPVFEPMSPASQADSLALSHWGSPKSTNTSSLLNHIKTQIKALSDSLSSLKKMVLIMGHSIKKKKKPAIYFKNHYWDFLGGPLVKTSNINCRGHGFNSWLGNQNPTCHMAWAKKKEKIIILICTVSYMYLAPIWSGSHQTGHFHARKAHCWSFRPH